MNPEQQRIELAKLDGWTLRECGYCGTDNWHSPLGVCSKSLLGKQLPDYVSDLNAVHELEKKMTGYQRSEFTISLRKIIVRDEDTPEHQDPDTGTLLDIYFYGATASQRCEAILRVKGIWK